MDDFCHAFYAGHEGEPAIKTYTFADLVSTLNSIAPNNWEAFFRSRLDATAGAPLGGLLGSGWRLVYNNQPNEMMTAAGEASGTWDFTSSIGLQVSRDGFVIDSIPGMPAFESGISPYFKIVGVNNNQFSADELKRAVSDSQTNSGPIDAMTENAGKMELYKISYHGGNQFPHLQRIDASPNYLDEILKPLTPAK